MATTNDSAAASIPIAPANEPAASNWRDALRWGAALLVLTLAVYFPVRKAGFIWDDNDYLTDNPTLYADNALARIWSEPKASPQYYPLVFTSFWLEMRLWGMEPAGYHFTNVLLHAFGTLLLWRVLVRLGVPGAWLAAALFAIHPVQVESVAWVTQRKNVLSGFFYWGALLCYLRFTGVGSGGPGRWAWYAASLALFVAALLSKTVTCTLPAVLVLLVWWQQGRLTRRDFLALTPMFALGIGMGLTTAFLEVTQVGAAGSDFDLHGLDRVLLAGRALWFYLGKLVWPVPLIFIYPRWTIDAAQPWQYLFPAAALFLAGVLWWGRSRWGWGPLVAYLCFTGTLFPALGFFDVYPFRFSFVADHFQYLACAAPLAVLAALLTVAARRFRPEAGVVLALLLLATLGALTWTQIRIYQDNETLFRDTLTKNPGCWMAHNNLGNLALKESHFTDAEKEFRACIELKPDHWKARRALIQTLLVRRHNADAKAELQTMRSLLAEQPNDSEHDRTAVSQEYLDIGAFYEVTGEDVEAEKVYRVVIELRPDWPTGHFRLGNSLGKQSKFKDALPHLRLSAEAAPDNADMRFLLAQAQHGAGLQKEGLASAREALRLAELAGNDNLVQTIRRRFAKELEAP
jgi:tetratricopeptide (TPR) repeat protein